MSSTHENSLTVRLPYDQSIQETFGVDVCAWKVLTEAVWPEAQKVESIVMALAYCKARQLDPLKRVVHIVPVWSSSKRCLVDTIWPSIAEARTTAVRTKSYAGRDPTAFGPDMTKEWTGDDKRTVVITFPEWAQITVYRIVTGLRMPFAGPQVYWLETYAKTKSGAPNSMWQKRPRGQLDKCAERAALAVAFPEELGDEWIDVDGPGMYQHTESATQSPPIAKPKRLSELPAVDESAQVADQPQDDPPPTQPVSNPQQTDSPQRQSAGGNGGNGKSLPDPQARAELLGICNEIASAGLTVQSQDYVHFELVQASDGIDPDALIEQICKTLSSFNGRNGVVSGKPANNLSGTALQITLKKASVVVHQLRGAGAAAY